MLILAADTSTPYLSIALCSDTSIIAEISILADRRHSEKLLYYTDKILNETDTSLEDIDMLAVAKGPGSFTGLRVGISAWKGLAAGANIPIIGISTLEALARRIEIAASPVCTLLDAKMKEVYGAVYQFNNFERNTLLDQTVAPIETILSHCPEHTIFLGDGASLFNVEIKTQKPDAQILPTTYDYPGAVAIAMESLNQINSGIQPSNAAVTPVYLRKSQAELNLAHKKTADSTS